MDKAFILLILIQIVWLYAELKRGRIARISLGVLSIVSTGFLIQALDQIPRAYESAMHRGSIKAAEEQLRRGETNEVLKAFNAYNAIAATGSTFEASEAMWKILKQDTPR
jgi:hypothetical protein